MSRLFRLLATCLFWSANAYSQDIDWPSPEVEQTYNQAKEYLTQGAVQQSIVLFRQVIQEAPDVMRLYQDLGNALNIAGNHEEAYKSISYVLEAGQPDEVTYQIASSALFRKGDKKSARKMIEAGIKAFPSSGMLFGEHGKVLEANGDRELALGSWLRGIEVDPAYHLNYYYAARLYSDTDRPIWTLIYGEIYVNLDRHSTRTSEIRELMVQCYKNLFQETGSIIKSRNNKISYGKQTFEWAVFETLKQFSSVVSEGITTENLVMLRTRFLMEWKANFSNVYPFTLFSYQEKMLKEGEFDTYNWLLFGKVEDPQHYESWVKFHKESISEHQRWAVHNRFVPTAGDFHNNQELNGFIQKKKRSKS